MRLLAFGAAALSLLVNVSAASAQANRTFVSGHGLDTNPCSLAAPCRTFQHAHDLTNAGGEITVLDPAGYGPVAIAKAISIVNDGVGEAGITTVSAVDAIDINGASGDVVNLRGLTLVGGGVGVNGIVFNPGGSTLNVETCVIRGFARDGVDFYGAPASGATVALSIIDTVVSNNGIAQGGSGIVALPTGAGTAAVSLNRVQVLGNAAIGVLVEGGFASGTVYAKITDSAAVGNQNGFQAQSSVTPARMPSGMVIDNSQAVNNSGTGLVAVGGGATLVVGQSTVAANAVGWAALPGSGNKAGTGTVQSFGDNYINGNVNDGGNPTLIGPQ